MAIYKGEDLLASSANSDTLVRNPDWGNAVEVTSASLVAGYTCPADGVFVVVANVVAQNITVNLKVNGVTVAISRRSEYYNSFMQCQVAVSKGDVVQLSAGVDSPASFVPYGLYTAPDVLVSHNYSQDEQFTGNYWIDGKKIYRKCFSFNRITVNVGTAWHTVVAASAIPGISKLLNYELISDTTDWTAAALARFNSGNFQVYPCAGLNVSIDTVILEYTKTTD